MRTSVSELMKTRRFAPLFITQALGAFNDNAYKSALIILIAFSLTGQQSLETGKLIAIASGCFILPFFVFSGIAGQIADKYDKSFLIRRIKFAEIVIMALAMAALNSGNIWILMTVLFLTGTQSAFFGPLKYAILPQHLKNYELLGANSLIETGTFLAILLGTLFGGIMILPANGKLVVGLSIIALAVAGYLISRKIPRAPGPKPDLILNWNIFSSTKILMKHAHYRQDVFNGILGVSWFWFLGAVFLSQLPVLTRQVLLGNEAVANLFIATFTIGIAAGSLFVSRLLRGDISVKYVPVAALALAILSLEFFFATRPHLFAGTSPGGIAGFLGAWRGWRVVIDLGLIAFVGGIYVVPLYAYIQDRTSPPRRARVIAANNVINAAFMVIAAILVALAFQAGVGPSGIFGLLAAVAAVAAFYALKLLPQEFVKSLGRQIFRLIYRVEFGGLEYYRAAGSRAVIVANHQSYLDGPLLGCFLPDKCLFAINARHVGKWWTRPLFALFDLLPLDAANPLAARALVQSLKDRRKVIIFPEGRISVTGALMKVYDDPASIARLGDAKLLPVRIKGAQYSLFSMMRGKLKIRPFPKITISVLPPVDFSAPDELKGARLRRYLALKLQNVMTNMVYQTSLIDQHLFHSLIDARSTHGGKQVILEDIQRKPLTYSRLITGNFVLGRKLAGLTPNQKNVAIFLPNANGCLVSMFGLWAYGRVPAMLNYSTGPLNMAAACAAAEVQTIITSHAFIEGGGFEADIAILQKAAKIIYLEDVRDTISLGDKLRGLLSAKFARTALKMTGADPNPEHPAIILFTSGSEGVPKGVVLSHRNLNANRHQIMARIDFGPGDVVFTALPMFHAFGLTPGTLLPVLSGIRTFLYPSPLHYKIVPELCYDTNATIMYATDTFLAGYARNAHPYDFYSLRYVVAGAERVKPETRALWMEKFGIRLLEGYGATECSPVLSSNCPMHFKSGTVGPFVDGIEYRLEAVEGIDRGGRLVVKGANIMSGYLHADEPGVLEPPEDGWYDTGDIVDVDEEGFVTILGRAKRFSKIAGEMISLTAVEAAITQAFPDDDHVVVAVPDKRKGEKLVAFSTDAELDRKKIQARLKKAGIVELMIPREIIHIEEIPVLGSGKTDYVSVNRMAREQVPE